MKKFLSLLLSLCLMTSLATQAFAAGESGSTDVTFTSDVMAPDVLNVVVPAEIPIHMSAAGDIQVASTLAIENKSSKAVEVQAVRAEGKNGWAILDYDSDFSDKPTGTKDLALSFRGDGTGSDGQIALTAGNWRVETGSSLPINADAKLPMQTETAKTSIATVYWTLDFADDSGSENPDPDDKIEISVLPGAHGSADCDILYPDDAGLISEYPGVTADTGYDFTHFVDAATGDSVDENTVYTADGAIRPVFELKPGWIRVPVPETPGVTFKPENDPEILIDPDGVVQVVPDVKPDEGYKTDGFVDENTGKPVGPGSVIDIDITINITINVYPDGSNPGGGDEPDPDDKTVTVPVLDGEHGSADADSVTTGSDGKIDPFPGTTPDEGYLFDHWENQDGQPVDGDTIFENGDSIKPVFKPDPDYKPDLTVTVDVLPGEHGTCTISTITTTSEGKIHTYPDVTPDDGWVLDHWENQDGEPVDENTVWSDGEGARPVYVEAPVEDVTVSFAASRYNGTISGNTDPITVPAGTTWGEITKPVTNVGKQAAFMGWYDGETELTDDFEITSDMTAMANFKSWYWTEGSTVKGLTDAYTKSGSPSELRIPATIDGVKMTEISGIHSVLGYSRDSAVTSVYVEDGYTAFSGMAFCNEWDIRSFRFPSTLQTIDYSALYKVGENTGGALGSLTLPSSVKSIGDSAFNMSGWTSITIPDGCMVSRGNVFNGMASLTYLKIGSGSSDFSFTFQNLPALKTLVLPSTTRTLGSNAFSGLPNLRTVQIYAPKSLVSGSNNPDGNWNLNGAMYAPNATITWVNG